MASSPKNVKLQDETEDILTQAAGRVPTWAKVQIANKLLAEACQALLDPGPVKLPTLDYLRAQIHGVAGLGEELALYSRLDRIEHTLARVAEGSPPHLPRQAQARRAERK